MNVVVLWIYIVLLLIGGLMGYMFAKSRISLISSAIFGALLILCAIKVMPFAVSTWLLAALLLLFAIRYANTRRFVPSGLMLVLTLVAAGLVNIL